MKSQFVHSKKPVQGSLGSFNLSKTASGAGAGATVGSVVPGPGTAIGAGAGAVIGTLTQFIGKHSHKTNAQAYNNAPNDKVTIFADVGYNGASKSFGPGTFRWLGKHGVLSRDKISSIKVPPGLQVEVWMGRPPSAPSGKPSDNGGAHIIWQSDKRYVGDKWNDHIDTIRVSRVINNNSGGNAAGNPPNKATGTPTNNSTGSALIPGATSQASVFSGIANSGWLLPVGIGAGAIGLISLAMSGKKN